MSNGAGVAGLLTLIDQDLGVVSFAREQSGWTVAVEWGREGPDSPMAGGASYGVGETLTQALSTVLSEIGLSS